jgi:hypothetical protein
MTCRGTRDPDAVIWDSELQHDAERRVAGRHPEELEAEIQAIIDEDERDWREHPFTPAGWDPTVCDDCGVTRAVHH